MRYILVSLSIVSLVLTSCAAFMFSQNTTKNRSHQQANTSSSFAYGDILANPHRDGSLVEARVSQMALIAFKNSYPSVTYSKWYRVRRNYLVSFKVNKYLSRALYDFKGELISSFLYGSENDLPSGVAELVKNLYPNCDIFLTTEVYEAGKNTWVINLDNQKVLVCISVQDDFIQELTLYNKSK
jgi:hypothetical protein